MAKAKYLTPFDLFKTKYNELKEELESATCEEEKKMIRIQTIAFVGAYIR